MSCAVELRDGDDVATHFGDIEECVVHSRLAAADAKRLQSSLESSNSPLQHCYGRVLNAGIAIARRLKVEESRGMIGAVECMGDCLIDGHCHGLGGWIGLVAAMDGNRFALHAPTRGAIALSGCSTAFGECVVLPASGTRLFISRTTHSISASVVLKLVTHARMTGTAVELGLRHPGDLTFTEGSQQAGWNKTFASETNQGKRRAIYDAPAGGGQRVAQHLPHVCLVINHRGVARLTLLR